ncbi:hypothetical protein [Anaerobacillus arseniciselenatis]|uniref:hypothetical protein n=1 Tax=Anaerobacillus arseniciselenatis TaxID=85682 RepID=UPI0014720B6D|nr:hypothetical protein [Anaerobacillus arseniciselenatis]
MKSNCCQASVKSELREELYHGNDDEYELKIPFLLCSNCGELVSPPLEQHEALAVSK